MEKKEKSILFGGCKSTKRAANGETFKFYIQLPSDKLYACSLHACSITPPAKKYGGPWAKEDAGITKREERERA